jgi:hypothetical protein
MSSVDLEEQRRIKREKVYSLAVGEAIKYSILGTVVVGAGTLILAKK